MNNWKRTLQNLLDMDVPLIHLPLVYMDKVLGRTVIWEEDFDGVDGLQVLVLAHPYISDRYEITIEQDGLKWQAGFYEKDPDNIEYRAFEAAYFFRNLEELFTLDANHYLEQT